MTIATFIPPVNPSYATQSSVSIKIKNIQYGNGYEQRARDGINNVQKRYKLAFENITQSQLTTIRDFVITNAGVEAFYYSVPGLDATLTLYRTNGDTEIQNMANNIYSISFEIMQVFDI
jgi:phage-related protein